MAASHPQCRRRRPSLPPAVCRWPNPCPARPPPASRRAPLDKQTAACRALARSLPASLPPAAVSQVTALAAGWLGPAAGGCDGGAVQLQAEAAHLYIALISTAKAKLPPAAARQLLQQTCHLCRQRQQPGSVAAQELLCGCADLLAQLPLWYPQAPKPDLATAVAAAAAALEQQAGAGAARDETAATTRLLSKLLRALQLLLAEVGGAAGAACLLKPHMFGLAALLSQCLGARMLNHPCPWPAGQEGPRRQCCHPGPSAAAPLHLRLAPAAPQQQWQQHSNPAQQPGWCGPCPHLAKQIPSAALTWQHPGRAACRCS